ncbi:alkaline phosphatase family protein [Mycolicibacterium vaccae]|uniref:Type I phosphodiesterase/nucleotide pyrophosphatase n=1 Tax=Mycolicibacterium vaccae ATCC 25954 TaxID=1194972 RepID=K0V3U3_MYCVA|nr:alkaline phosphatase family protein [Mycolicibacterium vaccae]ANI40220.1 phosphodiesterase [Mycolicibacterium vaccae 95051]EJZ05704.1 type I phosphodiesterase/nucleotide pyrophosphatase [Mycolicibacterium vaccae ATCC 25954]MCV7064440.1 alkaline phosphatase family protein [Mycolicibacterium vaccae]
MTPPRPDPSLPHLADVVPAVLAAMGLTGFDSPIRLPYDVAGACVLLIDGLGAELLDAHAGDAPVLAGLRGRTLQVGFPSTTAAGLAAVGTGCRSGEHGMVGMSFRLPDVGVVNALRWSPHPWGEDLRDRAVPEVVQPRPTLFERAAAAGAAVTVISEAKFAGSGLTRAVLRGGTYAGVHTMGDLAAKIGSVVAERGFCYGYHADLDLVGHLHGPGSRAWRLQLRQVDKMVESIIEGLPTGGLLAVVADHGMVSLDGSVIDLDAEAALADGTTEVGGEVRARHVYTRDGATADVLDTWRATLGDRAWVITGDEAVELGWFGEHVADAVRARIGDVVAAARGNSGMLRRTTEPIESSLVGQHGSLTDAEQRIPLLVAHR